MGAGDWADLQEALLYVFGPLIHWGLVLFVSLGIFGAMTVIWLGLLRWLAKTPGR